MIVTRRAALLAAASAALAGCAQNKRVVLDRKSMVGVKRIGLPVIGVQNSPDVRVVNGISTQMAGFGLIGAIGAMSGAVVRGNRSDAVVRMMAARGFDPGPALTAMLTAALVAKGFTVVPTAAEAKRQFLPSVPASPDYDAVLDCYVSTYGFSALNDSDDSPYRATIALPVRLIGAGGAVLMQDTVIVSAGDTPLGVPVPLAAAPVTAAAPVVAPALAPALAPAPAPVLTPVLAPGTFRSFSDVEKDPAACVEALRAVFELAAAGVVRRVS